MPKSDGQRPPDWADLAAAHLWLPYTQMQTVTPPLPAVRTEGVTMELADGRQLLDGTASWWTACHGYNHPHIRAAVQAQLETMPHVMLGGLVHEPAARLSARLAEMLPGDLDHVFFSDSGSVAVEVALKMAIQYWINKGDNARRRILAFEGAYHGDTFATMALCDPEDGMHTLFAGAFTEQVIAPLPVDEASTAALGAVLEQHGASLAAMIVEPLVQGAGGMKMHAPETLMRIRELADRYGCLMICDEIFTGFARTGSMFAIEQAGVLPDIITLGKGLTGGTLPLAATVARAHIFESFLSDDPQAALMHGPTYMGNALACAAANASLDLFEQEPRLEQVAMIADGLETGLAPARNLEGVKDVRVLGAIGVIELERPVDLDWLKSRLVAEGAWIRPFGDIVYVTPALVMTAPQVARLTGIMLAVVTEWSKQRK